MAGILFNLFYIIRSRFLSTQTLKFNHPWDIPPPSVFHRILDKTFTDKFDEILVIGDIHGCFDEMIKCINLAHRNNDRKILKIFVGDLINKGEKNIEVLDYLINEGKDDCLAVRGNHDEVVIREYFKFKRDGKITFPANQWIQQLNQGQLDYIVNLPYTITIPDLEVLIVHAGLVPGIPLEENQPFDMVNMRNLVEFKDHNDTKYKPLQHDIAGEPWALLWKGPNHVYFGHDAKRGEQYHVFATGLDSGCVYGKHLTSVFVKGPRQRIRLKVKAEKVYQAINE